MIRLVVLVVLFSIGTVAACEHGEGGYPPHNDAGEPGVTPAPRGGGFCCPIDPPTCDCFRNGGWIPDATGRCEKACDLSPFHTLSTTDVHGCETVSSSESCLLPPIDAGVD